LRQAELPKIDYTPPQLQYQPGHWAGIDCSGMVWMAAEYAVRGDAFLESYVDPNWPSYPSNIIDEVHDGVSLTKRRLGRHRMAVAYYWESSYPASSAADPVLFWTVVSVGAPATDGSPSTPAVKYSAASENSVVPNVRVGDVLWRHGHVVTAYSDGRVRHQDIGMPSVWTAEANGDNLYFSDVGPEYFGRKVLIRNLGKNNWRPVAVLREVLWK